MADEGRFYKVLDIDGAPLGDYQLHGYETRADFRRDLRALAGRWKGRVGECVGERHGFLLLRFHDTPGGTPDEKWVPRYLLEPVDMPEDHETQDDPERKDETDEAVDTAFGFD